ncbi:hypothetical protein P692DRAFT_201067967 [Suillus brevipes Sb2]|nr:hypothetical protein P692DRAFT_201067967 [Suillus brevipes Sb2]
MSSYTPQTNLSLERSRLVGMMLGCVTYGVYFLLTVQAVTALLQRPRHGQEIANGRRTLLYYTLITFSLETISFSCNARYTETIFIDLRDAPGGPVALIHNAMKYRINFLAICCGYVAEWLMQGLLLYRCFAVWNWTKRVVIPMVTIYVTMIGVAIIVLVEAGTGAQFYNINTTFIYFAIQVVHTMLYTFLVAKRLLSMRGQMKEALAEYDSSIYDTIIRMVVESAMTYGIFIIVYIVAFAVHSNSLTTLCFLSIVQVQGITQLFIIIRVARGRAYTNAWSTRVTAAPTTLAFAGVMSIAAEGTNVARAATPEQDSVESCSGSTKLAEV